MKEKYKSYKVDKNTYRVSIPKRRIAINVNDSLCIVNHKNRWIVALCEETNFSGRTFRANQTINRSQAIKIIGFLTDYINIVKPTQATALHASIKAKTNGIKKSASELVGIALGEENNDQRNTNQPRTKNRRTKR